MFRLLAFLLLAAGCGPGYTDRPVEDPPAELPLTTGSSRPGGSEGPCATEAPDDYRGPCYHGALPAFFDDFDYDGADLGAPGSVFGPNTWTERDGPVETRGWFRYNRNDLPVPGEVRADDASTLTLRLPEGLAATDYSRATMIFSGAPLDAGTYHWRVRLSELGGGARGRHSIWLYTTQALDFVRADGRDTTRFHFAPELDYENENHFEQNEREGRVTRMSVTNHAGIEGAAHERRSYAERVPWTAGRGVLARTGPGTTAISRPAPEAAWADRWLDLLLVVDSTAQTVTYRMAPAEPRPGDPLDPVTARPFTNGPDFYPLMPLTPAFSVHWADPEGRLPRAIRLDVDWIYYTPALGLTNADVLAQVAHLQARDLPRVNTTGRPTFEPRGEPERLRLALAGPEAVGCEAAQWRLRLWPGGGRYQATFRYRTHTDRGPDAWQAVYHPALTLRPAPGTRRIELVATVQDVWATNGTRTSPDGWPNPRPGNYTASARRAVAVTCR